MDNDVSETADIPIFDLKELEDSNQLILEEDVNNDEQLAREKNTIIIDHENNEEDELQITEKIEMGREMKLIAIEEVTTENSGGGGVSLEKDIFLEEDEHTTWNDVKILVLQLKKLVDQEKKNPNPDVMNDKEKVGEEKEEITVENASEAARDLIRECLIKQPNGKTAMEEDIDKTLSQYVGQKKEMKYHQNKLTKILKDLGYSKST